MGFLQQLTRKILSGDSTDSYNDVEYPDRVAPEKTQLTFTQSATRLPPHSLTIVSVPVK